MLPDCGVTPSGWVTVQDMVKFADVVAVARDAQLKQGERERADQDFVEDVMGEARTQIEASGGQLLDQDQWFRLSEYALNAYQVIFPEDCNVLETVLFVGGRVSQQRRSYSFMVGPSNTGLDPQEVKDRADAVGKLFDYLLAVVQRESRLHER